MGLSSARRRYRTKIINAYRTLRQRRIRRPVVTLPEEEPDLFAEAVEHQQQVMMQGSQEFELDD